MSEWLPVEPPGPSAPGNAADPNARKYAGFHPWDLLLIIDLAILGFTFLFVVAAGPASSTSQIDLEPLMLELLMWFSNATNLVMMGAIPVVWLLVTRVRPVEGTLEYLGMGNGRRSTGFWVLIGFLLAVALAGMAIGFGYLIEALGADPGGDPLFDQVARDGSWALMVGIAITAGVSEEILFRGVLQKWLRWWGQALLFGLVHVNQGWWAVGFIVVLSSVFGLLRDRRVPLWVLMVAHAVYDMILLTLLKLEVG